MNIPKLLRDETNTKIINREEIINYIDNDNNLEELKVYLSLLEKQEKVNRSEVEEIISVLKNKLYNNNEFNYKYDLVCNDFDALADFYEENISYIKEYMKEINNGNYINNNIVIKFMEYCINRELNGFQNKLRTQNLFDQFISHYRNNINNYNENFKNIMNDIISKKDNLLNSTDNNAMDYKEDNYLSRTQVLSLSPSTNKGYNLTEEDLKLNKAAFVATTIILEFSLAAILVVALIILFKR